MSDYKIFFFLLLVYKVQVQLAHHAAQTLIVL